MGKSEKLNWSVSLSSKSNPLSANELPELEPLYSNFISFNLFSFLKIVFKKILSLHILNLGFSNKFKEILVSASSF